MASPRAQIRHRPSAPREEEPRPLCAGRDPEDYFPAKQVPQSHAERLCAGCPVIAKCLRYALDEGMYGIWGGTTEATREALGGRRPSNRPSAWKPCGETA